MQLIQSGQLRGASEWAFYWTKSPHPPLAIRSRSVWVTNTWNLQQPPCPSRVDTQKQWLAYENTLFPLPTSRGCYLRLAAEHVIASRLFIRRVTAIVFHRVNNAVCVVAKWRRGNYQSDEQTQNQCLISPPHTNLANFPFKADACHLLSVKEIENFPIKRACTISFLFLCCRLVIIQVQSNWTTDCQSWCLSPRIGETGHDSRE